MKQASETFKRHIVDIVQEHVSISPTGLCSALGWDDTQDNQIEVYEAAVQAVEDGLISIDFDDRYRGGLVFFCKHN